MKLWEKLSAGGEQLQYAWLRNKFGMSWQIVPTALMDLMQDKDPVKSQRVFKAMLQMKKIVIEGLKAGVSRRMTESRSLRALG